jgi:hypothetical protein
LLTNIGKTTASRMKTTSSSMAAYMLLERLTCV